MICKKCGAYNPDHATFCKVCAANLKEQSDADDAVQVTEAEEVAEKEFRPRQGSVKAPDFSSARRAGSFRAAQKTEEPVEKEDLEEDDDTDEEEEVKPAAKKSLFSRMAAPVKKHRVVDDDQDEDEDDEEDEDDYDDDGGDAEKLESEPKTTRFARPASKKASIEDDDDDEDEEDDDEDEGDEEEDGYDDSDYDDGDDDYEEYEPTPPRRKKPVRAKGKNSNGGFNIIALLIICLVTILLIIVGIVLFCNLKDAKTKSMLPEKLQFNCIGKASTSEKGNTEDEDSASSRDNSGDSEQPEDSDDQPSDSPVTGVPLDYSVAQLTEMNNSVEIIVNTRPGDIVYVKLPTQPDTVRTNETDSDLSYRIDIPKECYYPGEPLTEAEQTITPQIIVKHTDGNEETLKIDSFTLSFPTIHLELTNPVQSAITEDGVMAPEGNEMVIKGQVDDHTVSVSINGKHVDNIYTGGNFDYTYALSGEEPEEVEIVATKDNYVTTSCSFTLKPYVFIPEKMQLSVDGDVSKLKADKNRSEEHTSELQSL